MDPTYKLGCNFNEALQNVENDVKKLFQKQHKTSELKILKYFLENQFRASGINQADLDGIQGAVQDAKGEWLKNMKTQIINVVFQNAPDQDSNPNKS